MSRLIPVAKVAEILAGFSFVTLPAVLAVLESIDPGPYAGDPGYEHGTLDCRNAVDGMGGDPAIVAAIVAAIEAAALPQKTGVGLQGGDTTKAAARRSKLTAIAKVADRKKGKASRAWIDKQIDLAKARAKKFGAANGGLKTGNLTPVEIVYRVGRNFRKRK